MPTYWNKLVKHPFLMVMMVFCSLVAVGQSPTDNSPYSRYGLGDLISTDFGALNSLGGISSAYSSVNSLNISNPASLGFLRTTSFEVGLFSDFSWLQAGDETSSAADGNLTHMVLGFPLKNQINRLTEINKSEFNWGTAFGLVPYSRVGYDVQTDGVVPNIDTVRYQYRGTGGLYQLFVSNGVSYKNTSFGFTAGYLFGQIKEDRLTAFQDIPNSFSNLLVDRHNMNGFVYNLGVQHQFILGDKEDKFKRYLVLGATGNSNMKVNASTQSLNRRFNTFYGFDTITSTTVASSKATLPLEYSFGAVLKRDQHWLVGVDYSAARWSKYNNPSNSDTLADTYRIGFGFEYIPDVTSYNKYLKRVAYRLGGFYQLDPRIIGGKQLAVFGINAGLGLPIVVPKKGTIGHTNLSFEVGQLGYNTAIGETYLKVKAAFTLNDNTWFYKRQFE